MAKTNMFSGKVDKKIPKNLSECTRPDATVTDLHHWAEQTELWGQRLFGLIIGIGVVVSLLSFISAGGTDEDFAILAFITSLITWGFYAVIEYFTYHIVALLLSALASITQHTMISANIALYEAAQNQRKAALTSKPSNPTQNDTSAKV